MDKRRLEIALRSLELAEVALRLVREYMASVAPIQPNNAVGHANAQGMTKIHDMTAEAEHVCRWALKELRKE